METVCITGASSGIGAACAARFAAEGYRVILFARRLERVHALRNRIVATGVEAYAAQMDVRDRASVTAALDALPPEWREIDILINNAGLARGREAVHEASVEAWDEMIDTNLKGLLYVTRAITPGMVSRQRGHIINLGSLAGHDPYAGGTVYCGTKAFVSILSKAMKMDLVTHGIRVTSVDPGLVDTEFSTVRFSGDIGKAAQVYRGIEPLTAEDIADTIFFAASRPAHVNISEIVMMPTAQASSTIVHRSE